MWTDLHIIKVYPIPNKSISQISNLHVSFQVPITIVIILKKRIYSIEHLTDVIYYIKFLRRRLYLGDTKMILHLYQSL
uniref:Uncharacterized protein n=1 Tax=Lepeophtheirus salmonis TaxID=72036 RepID=A0A0K2UPG1_LEPSM